MEINSLRQHFRPTSRTCSLTLLGNWCRSTCCVLPSSHGPTDRGETTLFNPWSPDSATWHIVPWLVQYLANFSEFSPVKWSWKDVRSKSISYLCYSLPALSTFHKLFWPNASVAGLRRYSVRVYLNMYLIWCTRKPFSIHGQWGLIYKLRKKGNLLCELKGEIVFCLFVLFCFCLWCVCLVHSRNIAKLKWNY